VHVKDTIALTLKKKISSILSHHNLNIQGIIGQWYDDVSNMHGSGMVCKIYPLKIIFMHIMYIV
jgi:hypothetical protein